jgi:thioredoxin reductase (NADPH)
MCTSKYKYNFQKNSMLDVIIIGAGPTGLACAIEAQKARLSYIVLEKGAITETVRRYPSNMTFFSTPELLALDNIPFTSVNVRPTRREALQYYRGVVDFHKLNLKLHTRVAAITKETPENSAESIFRVETVSELVPKTAQTSHQYTHKYFAKRVIIATGYFDFTNRLGIEGEDLPHVSHYYDEPYRYAKTNVVVVGGRNSAVEAALELWRHGAQVTLVHRGAELSSSVKYWVRPDIENRLKNKEISAFFSSVLTEITHESVRILNTETQKEEQIQTDFVFPLIGYRPDEILLRAAGVELNENLIPTHNPATFETNVKGLYIAGSVACGCQTWTIFIENGRMHAAPIITDIRKHLG